MSVGYLSKVVHRHTVAWRAAEGRGPAAAEAAERQQREAALRAAARAAEAKKEEDRRRAERAALDDALRNEDSPAADALQHLDFELSQLFCETAQQLLSCQALHRLALAQGGGRELRRVQRGGAFILL